MVLIRKNGQLTVAALKAGYHELAAAEYRGVLHEAKLYWADGMFHVSHLQSTNGAALDYSHWEFEHSSEARTKFKRVHRSFAA